MHHRSKWYADRGKAPVLSGHGIHGQHLLVDRTQQLVVAKLSSQATPLYGDAIRMTYHAMDAMRVMLAKE